MDLIKIGKFIAEKRKAMHLTQQELANMLHLSEKTISKWECGKGFPDVSIVLELCNILGITANELLSGKELERDEVESLTDANIINLLPSRADYNLKKWAVILITVLSIILIMIVAFTIPLMNLPLWIEITILVAAVFLFFVSMIPLCALANSMGTFKCKHCGHRFTPKLTAYIYGVHTWNKRYLKCPFCQKKSFCTFESYKKQNRIK